MDYIVSKVALCCDERCTTATLKVLMRNSMKFFSVIWIFIGTMGFFLCVSIFVVCGLFEIRKHTFVWHDIVGLLR